MLNAEMRTLNLKRLEVCDIQMALTAVICGFRSELYCNDLSEERREIAERSLKKWEKLKETIQVQLDEQDKTKEEL